MKACQLLAQLSQSNVTIEVGQDGSTLTYKGHLDSSQRCSLMQHKAAILDYLKRPPNPCARCGLPLSSGRIYVCESCQEPPVPLSRRPPFVLKHLRALGFTLSVQGSSLHCKGGRPMTSAECQLAREHKEGLLALLARPESPQACLLCRSGPGPMCPECLTPEPDVPPSEPYLGPRGDLRIPLASSPIFRWWQGGQDPDVTYLYTKTSRSLIQEGYERLPPSKP